MPDVYRYTLTSDARISAARTGEKSEHIRAHEVIPGGTIRGALASLWWRDAAERAEDDDDFSRLFDAGLAVGQAVPVSPAKHLVSASAWLCKYRPQPACEAFAIDAASVWAGPEVVDPHCSVCDGPTHTNAGWKGGPRGATTTRTKLTPSGTAATGNLFSRDAIPARVTFEGTLVDFSADLDPGWIDQQQLRIGGKRSTMGAATISLQIVEDTAVEVGHPAVLRFRSPGLVVDRYGAPSLVEADLQQALGRASGEGVVVQRSWLRSERVDGWHMRSKLPKPSEWAIAAGSTAVISGLTADGWDRLRFGVGLRTLEGFGEVELLSVDNEPDVADLHASDTSAAPGDETSPLDALLFAFVEEGDAAQLREAQTALRLVIDAQARKLGAPAAVAQQQLSKPWAKRLRPSSKAALRELLFADDLGRELIVELDKRINQLNRGARR